MPYGTVEHDRHGVRVTARATTTRLGAELQRALFRRMQSSQSVTITAAQRRTTISREDKLVGRVSLVRLRFGKDELRRMSEIGTWSS